jgi:hypothetical protein
MERNIKFNTLRRVGLAAALFFGVLATTACVEEQQASTAIGESTAEDIFASGPVTRIRPGETRFLESLDSGSDQGQHIVSDIAVTEHQYPHGWDDEMSPVISVTPSRIDAHVALSGKGSDVLDNDVACDTLKINLGGLSPEDVFIGAVAISDGGDQAMVAWPTDVDGQTSDMLQLCFAEGAEPSDGVVLFVSDESR